MKVTIKTAQEWKHLGLVALETFVVGLGFKIAWLESEDTYSGTQNLWKHLLNLQTIEHRGDGYARTEFWPNCVFGIAFVTLLVCAFFVSRTDRFYGRGAFIVLAIMFFLYGCRAQY